VNPEFNHDPIRTILFRKSDRPRLQDIVLDILLKSYLCSKKFDFCKGKVCVCLYRYTDK
jgi:hypothetical protein